MASDRKKPGMAFWASMAVVGLVLYVLSVGPAVWLQFDVLPESTFPAFEFVYGPLGFAARQTEPTNKALDWYIGLWFDQRRLH